TEPQVDATAGLTLVTLEAPVEEPVVEPVAVETVEPVVEAPERDLRFVDGDRVNMRGGPGTDYEVVGKLLRDDMVEVLEDSGNGWLHLRDTASGQEGWMADWLVTAAN
ncbi:MAG TPA: SH3 domain-containing protein, partial [Marivita sp.]|nr:SH3 domain-containing protein [Marivita sp.]